MSAHYSAIVDRTAPSATDQATERVLRADVRTAVSQLLGERRLLTPR